MRFRLMLLLSVLAVPLLAQDSPPEARRCYIEVGISPGGQMESSMLENGSFPLRLFPGLTIAADDLGLPQHSGSPSFEFGVPFTDAPLWLYAGMELHPSLHTDDWSAMRIGGSDSVVSVLCKTLRGGSVYAGLMAEKRIFGFLGLYGKLALGWYRFDQTVFVSEHAGGLRSGTTYHPNVQGIGTSFGGGIYFNFWGTKLHLGYRALYVSDGSSGTVLSMDARIALSFTL